LPTDLLAYFPVFESVPSLSAPAAPHAEMGDLVTLMYPFRFFLAESLRAGRLPFWNPNTLLGAPCLANPISAVFYPPNWLFVPLPRHWAWSLQFPLRTFLAALFGALCIRRLGASRRGALLGAAVFALGGFLVAWQGWPHADCL